MVCVCVRVRVHVCTYLFMLDVCVYVVLLHMLVCMRACQIGVLAKVVTRIHSWQTTGHWPGRHPSCTPTSRMLAPPPALAFWNGFEG